ncbi:hypothetical protein M3Y98_00829700 [Aphelenchoides besseyi]|nr:hypothetical protein M3Y98_00829700 [Aphelenchoides besseyi]
MGNMKKNEKQSQKLEKQPNGFNYTHSFDLSDRILYLDLDYLRNEEGRFKIIEIALCFLAFFLSSSIRAINAERSLAMLVCSCCILLTFTVWCSKIMTLHRQLHPGNWFAIEFLVTFFVIIGLLTSTFYMSVCVVYWTVHNPQWQTLPLLASIALFGAAVTYAIDLVLLFRHRNDRTFIPNVSTYQM